MLASRLDRLGDSALELRLQTTACRQDWVRLDRRTWQQCCRMRPLEMSCVISTAQDMVAMCFYLALDTQHPRGAAVVLHKRLA